MNTIPAPMLDRTARALCDHAAKVCKTHPEVCWMKFSEEFEGYAKAVLPATGAPELYEALAGLLEIEDARIGTGAFRPNEEGRRRIDAARAALAKARGES